MANILLDLEGCAAKSFLITSKPAAPARVDRDNPAPEQPARRFLKMAPVIQKLIGVTQIVDFDLRSPIYKGLVNSHERTRPQPAAAPCLGHFGCVVHTMHRGVGPFQPSYGTAQPN